jgi:hypothetical protein
MGKIWTRTKSRAAARDAAMLHPRHSADVSARPGAADGAHSRAGGVLRRGPQASALLETLETRTLLSAASLEVLTPQLKLATRSALDTGLVTASRIPGYTPGQIRQAYGFDQVTFGSAQIPADGSGQTIAIVDAYNDADIASDLKTFDQAFGIPAAPQFTIVSQSGGSVCGIASDSGWASETALDVEWAHAIAPSASILLVEANSGSVADLMMAVDYARRAQDVSTVSMSWGGQEFAAQTSLDSFFTTPAGHEGVTFVAASGDSGAADGPQWPSSSPNVLGVGGTSLYTDTATGAYNDESAWSGGGGGVSSVEPEPATQAPVQSTGARVVPDVSYDADPSTGFAVYSSVPDQGITGWQEVGGTSAGSPQWAALVSIADQGRALQGQSSLDGAGGTLPGLYTLYTSGTGQTFNTVSATPGAVTEADVAAAPVSTAPVSPAPASNVNLNSASLCNTTTGLGTPQAPRVIQALTAAPNEIAAPTRAVAARARLARLLRAQRRRNLSRAMQYHLLHADSDHPTLALTTPQRTGRGDSSGADVARGDSSDASGANGAGAVRLETRAKTGAADDSQSATTTDNVPSASTRVATTASLADSATILSSEFSTCVIDNGGMPAPGSGANASASSSLTDTTAAALASLGEAGSAAAPGASAAARAIRHELPLMVFSVTPIDAVAAMNDAVAAFARDLAALPAAAAKSVRIQGPRHAWTITGAVIALDVALVGYWWGNEKRRQQKAVEELEAAVEMALAVAGDW